MAVRTRTNLITGASPASATSAQVGSILRGLQDYDWFTVDAIIIGPTGGTIDVALQRKIGNLPDGTAVDLWVDWLHFPQVAAGVTTKFSAQCLPINTITTVGMVAAAAFTTTLAASGFLGGHPGQELRAVCTTGSGTSVASTQNIYITSWNSKVS